MKHRSDYLMNVKVTDEQWETVLADMPPGSRSAYIREAVMAYMAEHPVLTALPLEEPSGVPIRLQPIQVVANDAIADWIEAVPLMFRSYLVRHCLRLYRRQELASNGLAEQTTSFDQAHDKAEEEGSPRSLTGHSATPPACR